eukprot:366249-Chlamydomonas_euryale.AAC.11
MRLHAPARLLLPSPRASLPSPRWTCASCRATCARNCPAPPLAPKTASGQACPTCFCRRRRRPLHRPRRAPRPRCQTPTLPASASGRGGRRDGQARGRSRRHPPAARPGHFPHRPGRRPTAARRWQSSWPGRSETAASTCCRAPAAAPECGAARPQHPSRTQGSVGRAMRAANRPSARIAGWTSSLGPAAAGKARRRQTARPSWLGGGDEAAVGVG